METAGFIIKTIGAMAIVLGLMTAALYGIKLWDRRLRGGKADPIEVISTKMIIPKKYLCIVRVADKILIIGASENAVGLLGTLEPNYFEATLKDKSDALSDH
ncbi:MAG: FliO/MopB family protein [Dissulfurimicrobium sp.]|uniref:FliO/MopB family protein n=1 Tax=Dissulfurimicrobium TaxID=1769732 RepID=UPI001EDB5C9E|nr:flagellar biosynthetic protein FliO [Dissulfurimicrobium hydrothermale]UKL13474.1 flagellar biosynthetic protein FliO [Dissulfurimicrobium hydrothermale]